MQMNLLPKTNKRKEALYITKSKKIYIVTQYKYQLMLLFIELPTSWAECDTRTIF